MLLAQTKDTESAFLKQFREFKATLLAGGSATPVNQDMIEELENVLEAATSLEQTFMLYSGEHIENTSTTLSAISFLLIPQKSGEHKPNYLKAFLADRAPSTRVQTLLDQYKSLETQNQFIISPLISAIAEDSAEEYQAELMENRERSNSMIANVVLIRLLRSITNHVFSMKDAELLDLLAHDEDDKVLLDALSRVLLDSDTLSAKMKTRLLGMQTKKAWLQERGGCVGLNDAAKILNVSRETLNKYRKELKVVAVQTGSRWKYPVWQFKNGRVVEGLAEVLDNLNSKGIDSWGMLRFLINDNTFLENNFPDDSPVPIDNLKKGHQNRVLQALDLYMTHSAA